MPKNSPHRIPALDGLRALSIALVLVAHGNGTHGLGTHAALAEIDLGRLGVRVFFVISGFLITTLLLAERERHGRISIKDFYIRRVYRIFPAFYFYLAVVLLIQAIGWITLAPGDAIHAATYTTNFHDPHSRSWWLGHLWSLSVEEQFYLLWPAVMVFLGNAGALRFALAAVVLAPILRVAVWVLYPGWRVYVEEAFPTVFDAIATGCVLACLRDGLGARPAYQKLMASPAFFLVPLAGLAAAWFPRVSWDLIAGQTVQNVSIALVIDWCLRHAQGRVVGFLEAAPLVWFGTLSYSLYLWQQMFLNRHSSAWVNGFPQNLVLVIAVAAASYYLVEKPFLKLRTRKRHID